MPHRSGAHSSDEEYRLPGGEPEPEVSLSRLKKRSRRRSSTSSARNDNYTSDIINNTRPLKNNVSNENTDDDVVCVTINDDDDEALVPDSTENTLDDTRPTDAKAAAASSPVGRDHNFDNDNDDDDDDDDLDNIEPLPDFHRKRSIDVDEHHSRSSVGADGDDENSRLAESVATSDATERPAGYPLDEECSRSRSDSRSLGGGKCVKFQKG